MKFGVATVSLPDLDPETAVREIAAAGFRLVDVVDSRGGSGGPSPA